MNNDYGIKKYRNCLTVFSYQTVGVPSIPTWSECTGGEGHDRRGKMQRLPLYSWDITEVKEDEWVKGE